MDQITPSTTNRILTIRSLKFNNFMIQIKSPATNRGNTQYPRIEILCKTDTFPPSTLLLKVTSIPPTKVIKVRINSWFGSGLIRDLPSRIKPIPKQMTRGPHRSQFFTLSLSSPSNLGTITCFSF